MKYESCSTSLSIKKNRYVAHSKSSSMAYILASSQIDANAIVDVDIICFKFSTTKEITNRCMVKNTCQLLYLDDVHYILYAQI